MKHVIIGTAGHVDHGKTLLIKALTGIDTDRLPEEKKRGITIEPGFAHLDWPDGTQAGIVDVPGHERFIKNMLAGAGGVDLAMLVVAADEGFMPQTAEHLHILTLLGIRDGLTVITKKDLVDADWLEMAQEEIVRREEGSFLAGKPILAVSAYTGEGILALRAALYERIRQAKEKSVRAAFRLPVDRVFSVDGFGTVVTGTLIEGCMREGDPVVLAPSDMPSRIRNLQVHGRDTKTAYAGQRVAVNLAGVKKADIRRGGVVARPGTVRSSRMLDVRLINLPDSGRIIENGTQVHLYHGSAVKLAKVVLLDRDSLPPGEECYAQLRMAETIAAKNGDRFVIRFYSPLETIGGGTIIDDAPRRHKRFAPETLESLRIKETGSYGDRVLQTVAEFGASLPGLDKLAAKLDADPEALSVELSELCAAGRVVSPDTNRYIAASVLDKAAADCGAVLLAYHTRNPLHAGMRLAELRQKAFPGMDQTNASLLLDELAGEGVVRRCGERYALSDFAVHYTKRQTAIRERLLENYRRAGLEPPAIDEMAGLFMQNERADVKQVLDSLLTDGELLMLTGQICYCRETFDRVCEQIRAYFAGHETMTLAEFRDLMGTSRKYALAILEYCDAVGVTRKVGDARCPGKLLQEVAVSSLV